MQVTDTASFVLAPNPGPMTLDGTNTWIFRQPGSERAIVVDPGPLDEAHLQAVARAAGETALILITHHHPDHTEGLQRFRAITGAPSRAILDEYCHDAPPIRDGEAIAIDGLEVRIVSTPGHTADSMSVVLPQDRSLLSGDTVLGHGTTIIAHPDGALGPYFDSIRLLRSICETEGIARILPAHGPVIDEPIAALDFYLTHREERLQQVRDALAQGAQTIQDVVEMVYRDVDRSLWPAAERSVAAQLEYLRGK